MTVSIHNTKIKKIIQQGIDTRHFTLAFDAGVEFNFKAGQFVNFVVPPQGEHKAVKRPYSIASSPYHKDYIDITWKRVEGGYVTNYLWTLSEGDSIQVQGPLGHFCLKDPLPKGIVFVSTGTGIAPFRSMIYDLCHDKKAVEMWNIFGNRYETEILYKDEFDALAKKYPNLHNFFTVSKPKTWTGEKEYVQFLLKKHIPDPQGKHIYICGLKNMISEVVKVSEEIGFKKEQIFFEKYD